MQCKYCENEVLEQEYLTHLEEDLKKLQVLSMVNKGAFGNEMREIREELKSMQNK